MLAPPNAAQPHDRDNSRPDQHEVPLPIASRGSALRGNFVSRPSEGRAAILVGLATYAIVRAGDAARF
jgi:hypothetical protein